MDNVQMIKNCENDEQLRELAKNAIEVYSKQAKRENAKNYIGVNLDINPINYHLDDPNFKVERYYEGVNFWAGYIPLGTKVVYGRFYNNEFKTSTHKGFYYYVDDDSYIYEFFKFIKEKDVDDEMDIIWLVHSFIKKFLSKNINPTSRYDINKLIYKNEDLFFRPVKEHSIKDFYHNGSAMCSEIALIAENLLSVLGLEVLYLEDKEHAYNIYAYHNKAEKKTDIYLLDYSKWVECYDFNHKFIGTAPYIGEIEGATPKLVDEMINEGKRITLPEYYLLSINGFLYEVKNGEKREYGTDFAIEPEKALILKRKSGDC